MSNNEFPDRTGSAEVPAGTAAEADPVGDEESLTHSALPPDPVVFGLGAAVVLGIVAWGVFAPKHLDSTAASGLQWVISNFGWLFVISANIFLLLAVVLAVSHFGRIRLGADSDEPEFSNLAWIAMMFSAGMGIGLMFWGVAEPLTHFTTPPPGGASASGDPEAETAAAARQALEYSLFHWTLHPWAIYAVAGLALAYATFRKQRGNRLSAAFVPLIGEHANRGTGRAIDLLGVFATVFGSATSLGLGALQMATGLELVADIKATQTVELIIIGALTAAFVVSAFSGVHRGVKWLSTANMLLAAGVLVFVFAFGPTVFMLDAIPSVIGGYLSDLLEFSSRTGAFSGKVHDWLGTWTIFYWAWWLSWAPFVGTFIARISRGRTVREFLVGVLLVPSGASAIWFCVMGGAAIRLDTTEDTDLAASLKDGPEAALFGLMEALPAYSFTATVCIVLIALYFVTGADSASLVLGSLCSRGSLQPRKWLVVTWGVLIGAVAAVLLMVGGLSALQQATILVALPFVLVMLALCVALVRELRQDPMIRRMRQVSPHGLSDAVRAIVGDELESQDSALRARAAARARALRRIGRDEDSERGSGRGSGGNGL